MRYPEDMNRPSGRGPGTFSPRARAWLIGIVVVVVVVVLSARAIARFYTDYLWFGSVGTTFVWRRILLTKVALGVGFSVVFAALLSINLLIAERIAPPIRTMTPEDELLSRYRELIGPRQRSVRIGLSVLFGLVAGIGASGQWNNLLLFRYGGSFGAKDPFLGQDIGFYIFKLPFLSYLVGWAFASAVIILMMLVVSHYLNGGIRLQPGSQHATPQVKAHLSVLLAIVAALKALDYVMQRYELLQSDRGTVRGATYTDVNAQFPALQLLILISVLSALLFLINIRRRGFTLPIVAVALWLLVSIVAGEIYPWFIQSFQVSRKESAREAPYIRRNIQATRAGLGLNKIETKNFNYDPKPADNVITDNASTIQNVRLLDPNVVDQSFTTLQSQFAFYRFTDLDVDRYNIGADGAANQVVLSTRELNPDSLPSQTWEGTHLIYTHGYGVALAPANAVTPKGRPNFLVSGVSPIQIDPSVSSAITLDRPEIYFGASKDVANQNGYAIVDTKRKEKSGDNETSYRGKGGVPIAGFMRRFAYYLRFGDFETLTSDFLTSKSRILYIRDVADRVRTIAPFLSLDNDPYPILVDGRIKFVVDAYTTASTYPYGQLADASQLATTADLRNGGDFNYLRNSVKAVVDAYDGTVTLYLTDDLYGAKDPIARAYAAAFPGLFKSSAQMPANVKAHLRYPEDMFKVQTAMWGRYHIDAPEDFYNASDRWDVAQDPGTSTEGATATTSLDGTSSGRLPRIDPNYLMMKVPGQKSEQFMLFRPFVPYSQDDSKKQLTSFMVAKSDPGEYGTLQVFRMTQETDGKVDSNRNVDGPLTANQSILSATDVSQQLTLLGQGGSKVLLGNLLIVPVGESLLYVRPVYVSASAAGAAPELRRVIVAVGDSIAISDTLAQALQKVFPNAQVVTQEGGASTGSGDSGTGTGTGTGGTATTPDNPADLLGRAVTLFADADAALKSGGSSGLSDFQTKSQQAQDLVAQAEQLLGGTTTTAPTTTVKKSGSP